MKIRRMAISALSTGVLLLAAGAIPADQGHKGQKEKRPEGALALPITGTIAGGGTFTGTLSLSRFVARDGQPWATGMVTGSLTSAAGAPLGTALVGPVFFPVHVEPEGGATATAAAPAVIAQATCQVVHVELGAQNINVLGLIVTTQPIVLDLSGDTAGPLGGLVCVLLDLLNNVVGLVAVLNQILGLLIGLLGGIIPG